MNIVIIGLSITSSWGNGHATTYRSFIKGLKKRGHDVLFLERDVPCYSASRDLPDPAFCRVELYQSLESLKQNFEEEVKRADAVIVGSYVPDGIAVGEWVQETASGIRAFYDIDTPVTLSRLKNKDCEYLSFRLIPGYDLYLSFTAGRSLKLFENEFGSPAARQFYCSVDPELYFPVEHEKKWDLGYLGTYSTDRQPALNSLLVEAANNWKKGSFVVAGPQYPPDIEWPHNICRIEHLAPADHVSFYNAQKFTLNITRRDMVKMGYSPSVRLFEAAACGIPVISDYWEGIETIFRPGEEILLSSSTDDTLRYLREISPSQAMTIGRNARQLVLEKHTGEHRAKQLEQYLEEIAHGMERVGEGDRGIGGD